MPLILAVEEAYTKANQDPGFLRDFDYFAKHYIGRPSPLYFAESLTRELGGAKIYFKRDELNHTGAHKINNTLGQALMTLRVACANGENAGWMSGCIFLKIYLNECQAYH